jgi:hypothetical protein
VSAGGGRWRYPPEFLDALFGHGLAPRDVTPPSVVRGALNDLYRLELRGLRDRFRAGRVPKAGYHDAVVTLRRKYWLLTLTLPVWERICRQADGA